MPPAATIKGLLLVALLGLSLFASSCVKKAPVPAPPPPPDYFQLGEKYFLIGDYSNAAEAYNTYLRQKPAAANRDYVLFRLALAYAFPESPVYSAPQSMQLLQQVARLPESQYKPEAQLLLRLLEGTDRLKADVSKRDERIKELTRELEKLKQIDMQRRPIRPPGQ